jgi:hypothetical protein
MKREFSPVYTALILILGCVTLRLLNNAFPDVIPNVSPLMAIAYVGAMYLPRRWGWLVGPAALVLTDIAFLQVNYRTDGSGSMFSWMSGLACVLYAAAGAFGLWIAKRKSLTKILSGSVACSFVFYIVTNTFSWWHDLVVQMPNSYPYTFAGWVQANTTGIAGYPPSFLYHAPPARP